MRTGPVHFINGMSKYSRSMSYMHHVTLGFPPCARRTLPHRRRIVTLGPLSQYRPLVLMSLFFSLDKKKRNRLPSSLWTRKPTTRPLGPLGWSEWGDVTECKRRYPVDEHGVGRPRSLIFLLPKLRLPRVSE